MNTLEARSQMRHLAASALRVIDRLVTGALPTLDDAEELRRLMVEARTLLSEAGYPGEGVWRGLQRANMGLQTSLGGTDSGFWEDVRSDLSASLSSLESLLGSYSPDNTDFRIVT